MKVFIISVLVVISTTAFMFYLSTHYRPVSEEEFLEFREEVNSRFNDLTADHDTIKNELDSLKMGQERLFNGQKEIYLEVKSQNSDSHFWDKWF